MSELEQYDEAWTKAKYAKGQYAEIEQARKDGKLNAILGIPVPVKIQEGQQWDQDQLKAAFKDKKYAEIEAAKNRGDLDDLLGIER